MKEQKSKKSEDIKIKDICPGVVRAHDCEYSRLSNKRDGWNKRDGRKISQNFGPKIHSPSTNFKFKCVFGIFKLYPN